MNSHEISDKYMIFFLQNDKRYKSSKKALKLLLTFTSDTPNIFSKEHTSIES